MTHILPASAENGVEARPAQNRITPQGASTAQRATPPPLQSSPGEVPAPRSPPPIR